MTQLSITQYTTKSFVVRGRTRDYKDQLLKLGGKFNAKLYSIQGCKYLPYLPGWIFSMKNKDKVQAFIDSLEITSQDDKDYEEDDKDDSDYEEDEEDDSDYEDDDKDDSDYEDDNNDKEDSGSSRDYKGVDSDSSSDYKDSVESDVYEKVNFLPKIDSRRRKRCCMPNGGLYPTHVKSSHGNNYIEYNGIDNGPYTRHKSSYHNDEAVQLYKKDSLFWWYYSCFLTFSTAFFIFYLFSTGTLLVSPYFSNFFLIRELGINRLPGLETNNGEYFFGDFWCNINRVFDVAA